MSWKVYEENCPGCRPCVIDVKTMKPYGNDTEVMQTVNAIWASATLQEKQAFHNVTCNNSRDAMDLALMQGLAQKIESALSGN